MSVPGKQYRRPLLWASILSVLPVRAPRTCADGVKVLGSGAGGPHHGEHEKRESHCKNPGWQKKPSAKPGLVSPNRKSAIRNRTGRIAECQEPAWTSR